MSNCLCKMCEIVTESLAECKCSLCYETTKMAKDHNYKCESGNSCKYLPISTTDNGLSMIQSARTNLHKF